LENEIFMRSSIVKALVPICRKSVPNVVFMLLLLSGPSVLFSGCNPATKNDVMYELKPDPLKDAQTLVERYAAGQPVGSEMTSYASLIEQLKKVDATKGDLLEKGLSEIEKSPASAQKIAKDLREQL